MARQSLLGDRYAKTLLQNIALDHPGQRLPAAFQQQDASQFILDALCGNARQTRPQGNARRQPVGVRPFSSVGSGKTKKAQNPQIILLDALPRRTNETHVAPLQVRPPAKRVMDVALDIGIDGIDGEIPPLCVLVPIVNRRNAGMAPVVFLVSAQTGDLKTRLSHPGTDRAMGQARGNKANPRRF